jgi:hypothetical protein
MNTAAKNNTIHILLSVDPDTRSGVCKECGTVRLYVIGSRKGKWKCSRKSPDAPKKRGSAHPLTNVDEATCVAVCKICGPVEIYPNNTNTRYPSWICKNLVLARTRKKKYGITDAEYQNLLSKQHGICAICKKSQAPVRSWNGQNLAVDHCHNTGKIRGLLCNRCNRSIGYFEDNADLLAAAFIYLASFDLRLREHLK